jgi:hypothetical protein
VLVTVARDGTALDRRRVDLVDEGVPKLPHHSEGQTLPLDEAVELVERGRVSAERHSGLALAQFPGCPLSTQWLSDVSRSGLPRVEGPKQRITIAAPMRTGSMTRKNSDFPRVAK